MSGFFRSLDDVPAGSRVFRVGLFSYEEKRFERWTVAGPEEQEADVLERAAAHYDDCTVTYVEEEDDG